MSEPRKHHYLPEFYLKRWATNGEGKVCVYRRPHGIVDVRWLHPAGVGFQKDLYTIPSRADPVARQEMETGFMTPIDTQAANALAYIAAHGARPPNLKLQQGWSRFVLSLLYRHPRQIEFIRTKVRENDETTWSDLERNYDAIRGPDDPSTYREYRETTGKAICDETEAQLIRSMIDSAWIGDHLTRMHWNFITLEQPKHGLLTSDDPVMTSNGVGNRDGFVIVPVGPRTLFLAVNDLEVRDAFAKAPHKLERAFNDATVNQAEAIVVGANEHHRAFVDRRLGRAIRTKENGWSEETRRQVWASPIIFSDDVLLKPRRVRRAPH
ncbi:DUF4238 domain-containing protein [Caulobacter sp. Root655]|uniref:DUF4238 domain-containing protein n=1 Tax=Caulobacter sp. Root655 TaxID=1736578 RepID=UPI0009EA0077|nr:DUF4238 domain-containing protein [Caulobacter sp. Root655]